MATTNAPPTADAGPDQEVDEGETVNLDGTGSSDPEDGQAGLDYAWTVADDDGTGLVTGDIVDADTATPSFTAPEITTVAGSADVVIQLEVTDSAGGTDTDTVIITVQDSSLLADVTGSGGLLLGGQAANVRFVHLQVPSDIVVEVDFDGDGDFSEPEEDITSLVLGLEARTGRDFPSLLTGRVAPGQLRATLLNADDRFSFFNASSPLNSGGNSLRTGRKVRVRTIEAADPDPVLLSRDRFRTAGALGDDELGNSWSQPLANDFEVSSGQRAIPTSEGDEHAAVVDVGAADCYAQVAIVRSGAETTGRNGNVLGIAYRWVDSSNYSLAVLDVEAGMLRLVDVLSGTPLPTGDAGLRLTGGGGHASTPDDSSLDIAGDITLIAHITTDQWESGTLRDIVRKWDFGTPDLSYRFRIGSSDALSMIWSEDGSTEKIAFLSATPTPDASGSLVLAAELNVDNGNSENEVRFWTASSVDGPWTQLGNTQVNSGTTSIHASAAPLVCNQGNPFNHINHHTQVWAGLAITDPDNATLVADVDFAGQAPGDTSFTDAAGLPWTVQGDARIVGTTEVATEVYTPMTIGVRLSGSQVTLHVEGVPLTTSFAPNDSATQVGLWAEWGSGNSRPELDDWHVWDRLPAEVEGILWTGDVSDLISDVQAGPIKTARLEGRGWLARPAGQQVSPPSTVEGRSTGLLVGSTLGMVKLLHPPGPIDLGDVTTGPFGMRDRNSLDVARRFEETELGLLFETQEGQIGFDSRTARDAETVQVTFSDAPGAQFGFHDLTPLDRRREVINRVSAGVTPAAPSGISLTVRTPVVSNPDALTVSLPATVDAGDLLLVLVAAGTAVAMDEWFTPEGWTDLTRNKPRERGQAETAGARLGDDTRVYARRADGTEGGTTIVVAYQGGTGITVTGAVHVYRVTDWYGSVEDGVRLGEYSYSSDPGTVFPPWRDQPVLFVVSRQGIKDPFGDSSVSGAAFPVGYSDGVSTHNTGGSRSAIQSARRMAVTTGVENPGAFGGTFTGFGQTDTFTLAVRGPNPDEDGNPSDEQTTFTVEDTDSQDAHNAIRTHRKPSNLFATEADAQAYGQTILDRHADDRPIVRLAFWASKSSAYRAQAIRRRVGHKIHLVADHNAGMGIDRDMFIESITHRWSHGRTLWRTTWELSPAADEGG